MKRVLPLFFMLTSMSLFGRPTIDPLNTNTIGFKMNRWDYVGWPGRDADILVDIVYSDTPSVMMEAGPFVRGPFGAF